MGCRGLGSPVWMLIFHWFSRDHPPGIDGVNFDENVNDDEYCDDNDNDDDGGDKNDDDVHDDYEYGYDDVNNGDDKQFHASEFESRKQMDRTVTRMLSFF